MHPPQEPHEVIVVDNASKDGSAEMVRTEHPEVKLLASQKNLGYAAGNNAGFAVAQGEYLLTLNPDTEVFPDTFLRAFECFRAHPEWGAMGAKQLHPTEGVQRSVRGFPSVKGIFSDITGLGRVFPSLDTYRLRNFDYEEEQEAPQPMGTFLWMRREALAASGDPKSPFDEEFPIFFNEVDLLYRMKKAGWPCGYSPEVRIKHLGGASTRQVKKAMIWESHRSLMRYLRKHHPGPFLFVLNGLVWLGALVRAKGVHRGFRF